MDLTKQDLLEIIACVNYYQQRHISISNPRHMEYEVILKKLHKTLLDTHSCLLPLTSTDNKTSLLKSLK